jgi:hypothetical protein
VKKLLITLLSAISIGTFVSVADAQLPPGSIMTTGTAHSHSVSAPLGEMLTCPDALDPVAALGGVASQTRRRSDKATGSEPGGNFLSDPIVSFDGLHVGKLPPDDDCSLGEFASDDSGAVGFDLQLCKR